MLASRGDVGASHLQNYLLLSVPVMEDSNEPSKQQEESTNPFKKFLNGKIPLLLPFFFFFFFAERFVWTVFDNISISSPGKRPLSPFSNDTTPLQSPGSSVIEEGDRSRSGSVVEDRSRSTSRAEPVVVLLDKMEEGAEDPDKKQQEEVIRLLRQCLSASQKEETGK